MGFAKASKVRVIEPKVWPIANGLNMIDNLSGPHDALRFAEPAERFHLQVLHPNLLPCAIITALRC
jgi:hypothetical protein